ncbi:Acylphosphatase [uncultured archaeon]|nr:Acylphosphatase [uncultured archaeon]
MVKIKCKIKGEKVHDVGYRFFLLRKALELGIKGFNAYNDFDNGQILMVQAEGNARAMQAFRSFADKKAPGHALVSERSFEDLDGYVMPISDYLHLFQVEQLNKGIPAIISIDNKQDKMLDKQDQTIKEIKGVSSKIDYSREQITSELQSINEGFKLHIDERLSKMEFELAEIKAKVADIQYSSAV